jgi:WhiB family transcriptional regulator, redox-sensing transcriptional regulator
MASSDWMKDARCVDEDPTVFFPDEERMSAGVRRRYEEFAKKICNGTLGEGPCPVREQCLEYSLAHPDEHGVWGGMTEQERRRFRKDQRRRSKDDARRRALGNRVLTREVD